MDCPDIPNIRHLRMVQMIGRVGGLTCASRMLNTSQPAVTQAVSNLENDIGAKIFERTATGTYPSDIGKRFLLRIDRFFDTLEAAVSDIMGTPRDASDTRTPAVERLITSTQARALIVASDPAVVEQTALMLGVSSATLYRSVRELERSLGRRLMERTANGQICTQAGAKLARGLRRAMREIEFARGEVQLARGRPDLEITVGALPMSGSMELAAAITAFRTRRPDVRVKIMTSNYHTLLDDLGKCSIDLIFGLLRRPDWASDVAEEALFADSFCIVARAGHPLSKLRDVTPQALAQYDWVVPAPGTPRRQQIERIFADEKTQPRFGIETSCLATLRALLSDSDLVTVMTRSEASLDANAGLLDVLPCRFLDPLPPKGITTRDGWLPTEAHQDFLDCLREATNRKPQRAAGKARVALVG